MNVSSQYFQRAQKIFPGGVHSPVRSFKGLHTTPCFVEKAKGYKIFDADQNDYIDFCMSFGPLILGHQHPAIKESILLALEDGWTYGACERYSLELGEYIIKHIPQIEQIRFVNSGTEAVMTAIRLARAYTGKNKIIKFNGCYHGHLDSMLVQSGSGLAGTMEASSKGVSQETVQHTLIAELDNIESVKNLFLKFPNEIAAIILEPLPANYGLLPQTIEFLNELRIICTKNKSLLIFDEVISGFRVAFGGMMEITKIEPDIITYGKIIGAGMPVGAIASKREIMEQLAPIGNVYQAGTLSANPVAMRAGLTSLKIINERGFFDTLKNTTSQIVDLFHLWANKYQNGRFKFISFEQQYSLFWPVRKSENHTTIRNLKDIPVTIKEDFYSLFKVLFEKGIYLAPNAYEVGFVSISHLDSINELEKRLFND